MEEYIMSVTMKSRAMEESMVSSKKRKLYAELENEYCGDLELTENSISPAASSRTSGFDKHDHEFNNAVKKSLRSPDLKNVDMKLECFETEIISTLTNGVFRETTPTSELCGEKKPPPPPEINPHRKISSEKMPSAAELEEFFTAAEKCEQKRFAEKYNYDIVKDVPMEGKYQWVRLRL